MRMAKDLEPGQNNIDTRKVGTMPDGTKRLQWDICLPNGRIASKCTKGKNMTNADVKRRAHKTADEMLRSYGTKGKWKSSSLISDYIDKESIPAVQKSGLRPRTITSYESKLAILSDALKGYLISDAARPLALQEVLDVIAAKHGTASAEQVRKVGNKWLFQRLVLEGVVDINPFNQVTIPITVQHVAKAKPKGGVALTEEEHEDAILYMLNANPNDLEKTKPKRGRYTQKQLAEKRRTIIEFSLLQATTGLRLNEGIELKLSYIEIIGDDVYINVPEDVSKTKKGRRVPILDKRVAREIKGRVKRSRKSQVWLFPAPTRVNKKWDRNNADKAINNFLRNEVAVACNIPALDHSHVWRTTLSTIAASHGIPAEIRAAYFGQGEEVNKTYYTDKTDITPFLNAMKK